MELKEPENIARNFKLLRKYQHKLDCLIFKMLFIRAFKPKLNKQCDSIRAKLFINYPILHCFLLHLIAFLLLLISNHLSSCDSRKVIYSTSFLCIMPLFLNVCM